MLGFDDLLAAKVALQMGLVTPEAIRTHLVAADASGDSLAKQLEKEKLATPDVARQINRHARLGFFLKAESVYLTTLKKRVTLDEAKLEELRRRQRGEGLKTRIGEMLVAEGAVPRAVDEEVVVEARNALTADCTGVVDKYRARGFSGIERPSAAVDDLLAMADGKLTEGRRSTPKPGESSPPPDAVPKARKATPPPKADIAGDLAFLGHSGEMLVPQLPTPLGLPEAVPLAARAAAAPPVATATPPPLVLEDPTLKLDAPTTAEPPPSYEGPSPLNGTGLELKYDVARKLGEGGMGAVWLAREKDGGREVALKLVLDREKSKEAADRFKREILATSFCGHENVIEIYDAGETKDGSYFMAMELIPGEELSATLKREGAINALRALSIFEQVLDALVAVHAAEIVHRDLKPQNFRIWREPETGRERVKIMDFGIARMKDDEGAFKDQVYKTMGGKITGSPAYIAPESITEPDVDGRADLYSLGVAMFRVFTGRLPFVCQEPTEYFPKHLYEKPPQMKDVVPQLGLPAELEAVVKKLLEKTPSKRYQSAAEVLEDLRSKVRPVLEGKVPTAGEATLAELPPPAPAPVAAPAAPQAEPAPAPAPDAPVAAVPAVPEMAPRTALAAPAPKKGCLGVFLAVFGV